MTAEAPKSRKTTAGSTSKGGAAEDRVPEAEAEETAEPLNREERRAKARGKKAGQPAKNPIGSKKSNVRSQMPGGGVGKFQLPTKNG
ncbi:hypothetical protein [Glycomyces sp. NRRL B-16210]|uniref:hypothetical protein n=1 Tax=Glycomyces sp. NRRL B-16210 TaxID=1463821 RepID=UPI0004C0575D|nr:hypothetical protein [Glycomyces sp. NRRL B-16210]